jgi:pantoate kinase
MRGKGKVDIYINGRISDAPVSRRAVQKLLPKGYDLTIQSEVQLPISQGFGMSGAGALSSVMAVADLFRTFTRYEVVKAAHEAEVELRTGLGDVAAQSVGGAVIRSKTGIPPYGLVENLEEGVKGEIVIAVIGEPLSTKSILGNASKRDAINGAGLKALASLSEERTLENLFRVSYEFALETDLMSPQVRRGVEEAHHHGLASMAMLGNSLFGMGDTERMTKPLRKIGTVYICLVDKKGAREW